MCRLLRFAKPGFSALSRRVVAPPGGGRHGGQGSGAPPYRGRH